MAGILVVSCIAFFGHSVKKLVYIDMLHFSVFGIFSVEYVIKMNLNVNSMDIILSLIHCVKNLKEAVPILSGLNLFSLTMI